MVEFFFFLVRRGFFWYRCFWLRVGNGDLFVSLDRECFVGRSGVWKILVRFYRRRIAVVGRVVYLWLVGSRSWGNKEV